MIEDVVQCEKLFIREYLQADSKRDVGATFVFRSVSPLLQTATGRLLAVLQFQWLLAKSSSEINHHKLNDTL